MTVKESTRQQWQKLKGKPLKDKLIFIKTYYLTYILFWAFLLFLAGAALVYAITAKDYALQAYFLHAVELSPAEEFQQDYLAYAAISPDDYMIAITPSSESAAGSGQLNYNDTQAITAWAAAEAIDVLAGEIAPLVSYAYSGYFCDLRNVFSNQQLEAWAPHLLYMDQSVAEEITESGALIYALPDPHNPDEMKEPIPFALSIPDSAKLLEAYDFYCAETAIGIVSTSARAENAAAFLEYSLQ